MADLLLRIRHNDVLRGCSNALLAAVDKTFEGFFGSDPGNVLCLLEMGRDLGLVLLMLDQGLFWRC